MCNLIILAISLFLFNCALYSIIIKVHYNKTKEVNLKNGKRSSIEREKERTKKNGEARHFDFDFCHGSCGVVVKQLN